MAQGTKKGRAVAANERKLHDHLHGMMQRREIHGWSWPDKGMVAVFDTETDWHRYHLTYQRTGFIAAQLGDERVAEILALPPVEAMPMALAAAAYGLETPAPAKRAGKADLVAVLRDVLAVYGDAFEDCPAILAARTVLEAA